MNWLNFKDNGEEHNFWQNYTDLMSGFLIVFIIASLVSYRDYKEKEDKYSRLIEMAGGSKTGELTDLDKERLEKLVSNAELYQRVAAFDSAQSALESKYFHYDTKFRRFECVIDAQFDSESSVIKDSYYGALIAAGEELIEILRKFPSSENVSFKVNIDGRAALKSGKKLTDMTIDQVQYADNLSYNRARSLYNLWEKNGVIKKIELDMGGEVFVSGSGYKGKGRHTHKTDPKSNDPEGLNKRFIIVIVPFIKF